MPIRWSENLIVALITFMGTVLSMILGKSVLLFYRKKLAGILGSVIIILIGAVGLVKFFMKMKKA